MLSKWSRNMFPNSMSAKSFAWRVLGTVMWEGVALIALLRSGAKADVLRHRASWVSEVDIDEEAVAGIAGCCIQGNDGLCIVQGLQ